MGKFNSKVEPSPGMDCVQSSRLHCIGYTTTIQLPGLCMWWWDEMGSEIVTNM
jgi:hypothetical protein